MPTHNFQCISLFQFSIQTISDFQVSSCERVQEMSKEILLKSQSSIQLEGLDFKGVLARLKVSDVQRFASEERTNVSKLNTEVTKAQAARYESNRSLNGKVCPCHKFHFGYREKQKQLAKDIDACKVNVDQIKVSRIIM